MNPVEKIKYILNELTEPLCKDDPFGTGGRKAIFDTSCKTSSSLSFQAFVNRITTFKPEHWSSDPNAAIYLAKYGFKTVSKCIVHCCTCENEVDMGVFLGKPDILQALTWESHKKNCRWLCVSTPKGYFDIARGPERNLNDFKVTFSEMMTFQSYLPLVLRDTWMKMGISEDFVKAVLHFLEFPYNDILASCVVLSLCGWVKSNDRSLQCNFCQRVVGVWNFFSGTTEKPKTFSSLDLTPVNLTSVGSPSKKSRVLSLLYSEIRRSMVLSNDSEGVTEQNTMDVTEENSVGVIEENSVGVTEENSVGVIEENSVGVIEENSVGIIEDNSVGIIEENSVVILKENSVRITEPDSVKAAELDPMAITEENPVGSAEINLVEQSELPYSNSLSPSAWDHGCSEHTSSPSRCGESTVEPSSKYNTCDEGLWDDYVYLRAQDIKKRALRFLWNKQRRAREKYYYKFLRLKMQRESAGDSEETDNVENRQSSKSISGESDAETELNQANRENSDVSSNSVSDHNETTQAIIDAKCKSNNNGASSDKNGFYSTEHDVREESCAQSLSSVGNETIVTDSSCDVKSSYNSSDIEVHADSDSENKCAPCFRVLNKNCVSRRECVVEFDKLDKSDYSNDCDMPEIQSSPSEKSGNTSAVSNDEQCRNPDGRKKRKRVPECERNGNPYDTDLMPHLPAQMEPAHLTRSKKKELELILHERTKSGKLPSSQDNGTEVIEILSSEGEAASECEMKTPPTPVEPGGNNTENEKCNDTENAKMQDTKGSENNSFALSNHEEDNSELTPVICSVVGNAVIQDNSEEEMDVEGVHNKEEEFSAGPIIVSAKSVCDEGMLQDYVEEEGRKFENGYRAKDNSYSDASENESPVESSLEKSLPDNSTTKTNDGSSVAEDNVQSRSCKRKRSESDEGLNHPIKMPNLAALAALSFELPPAYFHPELEHRYWCVWRVATVDRLKHSFKSKKGWELYMGAIEKGLELQKAENCSVGQVNSNTICHIADILGTAEPRSK